LLAPGELCGYFATNIFFRMEHWRLKPCDMA
jgi:hypothetical protein